VTEQVNEGEPAAETGLDTGLTNTLKRRIAAVFGGPEDERKRLKKQFDKLYSFRSDLVHGNAKLGDREIMKGHLAESRDFARGVAAQADSAHRPHDRLTP
jgi:hypothetical protein